MVQNSRTMVRFGIWPGPWVKHRNETAIWTMPVGVECMIARYDDARYQLRLVRPEGTIRADLFVSWDDAIAAAERWRAEIEARQDDAPVTAPDRKPIVPGSDGL